VLKGRWQSLRELRIQIHNQRSHRIAILWAWCCLILHNLVIHLEGEHFNDDWREALYTIGHATPNSADEVEVDDSEENSGTAGQQFRLRKMNELFDCETSSAKQRD